MSSSRETRVVGASRDRVISVRVTDGQYAKAKKLSGKDGVSNWVYRLLDAALAGQEPGVSVTEVSADDLVAASSAGSVRTSAAPEKWVPNIDSACGSCRQVPCVCEEDRIDE